MLAQHANDLILGKSASPHHSSPSDELTYQRYDFRGAGHWGAVIMALNIGRMDHQGVEKVSGRASRDVAIAALGALAGIISARLARFVGLHRPAIDDAAIGSSSPSRMQAISAAMAEHSRSVQSLA